GGVGDGGSRGDGRLGPGRARRRGRRGHDGGRARAPGARARADARLARARACAAAGGPAVIELDGGPLTLEAVEAVARRGDEGKLAPTCARRPGESRAFVDRLAPGPEPTSGITTGVGQLNA